MEHDPKLNGVLKITLNKKLEIVSITPEWCELLKCPVEKVLGQSINSLLSEKYVFNALNLNTHFSKDVEVEMITCEGLPLFVIILLEEVAEGFVIYGQDLTMLRKAQINLSRLEHLAKVGCWEQARNGVTIWSDEVYDIFEVPVTPINEEFFSMIKDCFIGNSREVILTNLQRILSIGGSYDLELEIVTAKGNRKWVRTTGTGVMDKGEIIRAEGMIQDVSAYRENLIRLFESQEHLEVALAANAMGVWKLNLRTDELSWDENMCKIYGIAPEDAPKNAEEFFNLIYPEDVKRLKAESTTGLINPETFISSWFRILVNGEIRFIATRSGYAHSLGDDFYIGVNWDITREKQSEETIKMQEAKIITSARLSSLGEMAGGIAHEINNPLSVILARASQLKRRSSRNELDPAELVDGLAKIEETCNRIVKIINGLKTISRDGANDPFGPVSLQLCLQETISLVSEKLKHNNVEIELITPNEEVTVQGRLVQLEQVLMNILHNSYDAIAELADKKIMIKLLKLKDVAEVRISDSGLGVPAHLVDKIFVPFFTTKDVGKGTGIGLSITRSIVQEHGGEFSYVKNGKEWYFSLTLPLLEY